MYDGSAPLLLAPSHPHPCPPCKRFPGLPLPQVLPVYALTTAAGSHSAASVIQHALRKNIKPDLAR